MLQANTTASRPSTTLNPVKTAAPALADIVISRARFGVGFVIVKGFDQLRDQLARNGVAEAFFQSTKQCMRVRKNSTGDLVEANDSI